MPVLPESRQIPRVLGLLGLRVQQRLMHKAGQCPCQHRLVTGARVRQLGKSTRLDAPAVVTDLGQVGHAGLRPVTAPLLQAEQHLGGQRVAQACQADGAVARDRRLGQPPALLVQSRVCPPLAAQPDGVLLAVRRRAAGTLPRARGDLASPEHRQRHHTRAGHKLRHRQPELATVPPVRLAQRLAQRSRHPLASLHRAHTRLGARGTGRPGICLPRRAAGAPPPACLAGAADRIHFVAAGAGLADRPAQQTVISTRRQGPGRRIPSRVGEEPRLDQPGHTGGRVVAQVTVAEHVRRHRHRGRPHRRRRGRGRKQRGHEVTPVCTRGLGTASTAARSRAGSGCTYTCVEHGEA